MTNSAKSLACDAVVLTVKLAAVRAPSTSLLAPTLSKAMTPCVPGGPAKKKLGEVCTRANARTPEVVIGLPETGVANKADGAVRPTLLTPPDDGGAFAI